jgi:putative endopeptidase
MMSLAGLDKKQAKSAVKEILEIETTLAKASKTRVERRDPKGLYNRVNRDGLMKLAPTFPWDEYFKALGAAELKAINVTAPKFFEAVDGLVKTLKPAQWQLYLRWHLIRSMAPQLGQKYADEAFAMEQAITGQTRQQDRWKRCVEATDRALGELLAQPFVETKFGAESKKAVEQMVFAIRDAFGKRLDQLDWMDDTPAPAPTRSSSRWSTSSGTRSSGAPTTSPSTPRATRRTPSRPAPSSSAAASPRSASPWTAASGR